MNDEEKFEQQLKRFRPREVRPLLVPNAGAAGWKWAVGAAAVCLVAVVGALWVREERPGEVRQPAALTVMEWNIAAKQGRLAEAMTDSEKRILPSIGRPHSALSVLGKE